MEFGNVGFLGERKAGVPGEEKPRGGWTRTNTEASVNVPDKRWLLKQYSYFMFIIKTLCDYF